MIRHALRNAMIPIVTVIGLQLGVLLAGSIVTEVIFSIAGVGKYLVDSMNARDYAAVQGCVLLIAFVSAILNLIVDNYLHVHRPPHEDHVRKLQGRLRPRQEERRAEDRMKKHTMLSEIWRRFKKNKQAVVGLIVLIIFILVAIFAKQIAPYWYDDQDASRAMIGPCAQYPFGTDNLGRDVLSRLIYGSRYSLSIGFLAVGISVLTGGFLGVIAAYYPKLDNIIMRCMDLFMAIPQMLLAMCIVSALGSSLFNLMLAVGLSSTPKFARVVRASVLATREQEFVEAARAIGASNTRIILHHILPNSISALIVQATLAMAGAIISASALSFLGFGIQAPMPEWGAMLSAGRKYIRTQAYLTVIPGLAIMVVVYALNVVGDGLRDCLDPRLKK